MRRRYTGRKRKRRIFRRGYDRTGGFYGRFRKRRRFGGFPRIEKKFYDKILTETNLTAAGQLVVTSTPGPETDSATLNDIPQGTGESQRIGRKCTITKILIRLNCEFLISTLATLATADTAHETLRIVLYWDKQCNGASATALNLLDTVQYNSYRNIANSKRFVFLYDKLVTFNTTAIAEGNGTNRSSARVIRDYQLKINKKVFIPIEFDSTTGALTEIRSNNIGLRIWTKHGGRMAIAASKMRIRFMDY